MKRKTNRSVEAIDFLIDRLTNERIYRTYNYRSRNEFYMKGPLNEALRLALEELFRYRHPNYLDRTIRRKAEKALAWEGNPTKSIKPTELFGVTHRPDFSIEIDSISIAVEIKVDDSGSTIRSGLGQSLVYSTEYDFVICLIIDTSSDAIISQSTKNLVEANLIQRLWNNHNIRVVII